MRTMVSKKFAIGLLATVCGCATVTDTDPTRAVQLLAPSLQGKFACYLVPSAYYVPGTVIRIERDPENPDQPKRGAEPIPSIKSPVKIIESAKFVDKWSVDWTDKTIEGSLAAKVLAPFFGFTQDSQVKLSGSRGVTMKAEMENVKELMLYDDARKQIREAFQGQIDEIQPNYLYYWIKGALMPEKVRYVVKPTAGAEFTVPVALKQAHVELRLKSGQDGTGEITASGVINCIQPQSLEIRKTHKFVGPPEVQITFKDLNSPAETPFGRLPKGK